MKELVFLLSLVFAISASAQDCPDSCEVYIPNVLTPDCEGMDCELLNVISNCEMSEFHLTLYNRWGEIIFETKDSEEEFDSAGYEDGVYTYRLKITFCNNQKLNRTDHINIIR
ncbi:MAG: gliding motility-associated C-terminal domain-containing protein [Fluviicola sp.]